MSIKKQIDFLSHHQARFDIFVLLSASAIAVRTVLAQRCEPRCDGNFSGTVIVHDAYTQRWDIGEKKRIVVMVCLKFLNELWHLSFAC
jgi:hypothetical protein